MYRVRGRTVHAYTVRLTHTTVLYMPVYVYMQLQTIEYEEKLCVGARASRGRRPAVCRRERRGWAAQLLMPKLEN